MNDAVLPLFVCEQCHAELWTWEAAAKAEAHGCPACLERVVRDVIRGLKGE